MKFTQDVQETLNCDSPDLEQLQKLHLIGSSLDLDIPEVNALEQALEQKKWLEEVSENIIVSHYQIWT